LVNNAIKFTNKGGFVSVTAKSLPYNEVEIAVSDNGLGISDEMIDKLFSIGKKQEEMELQVKRNWTGSNA
jgi:signal transduction histidine kinase